MYTAIEDKDTDGCYLAYYTAVCEGFVNERFVRIRQETMRLAAAGSTSRSRRCNEYPFPLGLKKRLPRQHHASHFPALIVRECQHVHAGRQAFQTELQMRGARLDTATAQAAHHLTGGIVEDEISVK